MIYIDSRTGSHTLQSHILNEIETDLTYLEYGDVSFMGNGPDGPVMIGIERKTISDLASSIATGRLSGHQLIGMLNCFDYVYIVVEGVWQANPVTGIIEMYRTRGWQPMQFGVRQFLAKEVTNYLNTLAVICNVLIWHTNNITQTGKWISDLYSWWQKPWDKHTAHLQLHETPVPKRVQKEVVLVGPSRVRLVAKEFPSIGWTRSKAVAERFKSVREFVNATREQLLEVPGIGKTLAERIIKELEE